MSERSRLLVSLWATRAVRPLLFLGLLPVVGPAFFRPLLGRLIWWMIRRELMRLPPEQRRAAVDRALKQLDEEESHV